MNFLNKKNAIVATVVTAFLSLSVSAHAALPAGVSAFFADLTADFSDLLNTYMYPLMLAVTGGLIILGLVKRGAKKAT